MSKKTKAAKHAARVRSHNKRRPNRVSMLEVPPGYIPKGLEAAFIGMAFDQMLLHVLRASGIRDALFSAIKNAPPKGDEKPKTIQ